MARSSDRAEPRIGHDARAAATGTLDTALGEGRVDLAEYERRLVVIQAAKVATDLTPAITDLPSRHGQRGPGLRISTADREQAQVRLTEALTDGRLVATDYAVAEELLRRAVTYADMDAVVGDLDAKASLAERDQAIERIEAAVDAGLLDPAERHGRVEAARNATTDAQLAALVADLTTNPGSPAAPARVSNADREAVAARLHAALEAGFLDLTEFDERVREVYAARLSSELERVVADLPEPAPPPEPPVEKPRRERRPVDSSIVIVYGIFGLAVVLIIWGVMYDGGLGALAVLPPVLWLTGLVALVRRARRPVAADPAADLEEPHVEQLQEEIERRAERLTRQSQQLLRSGQRLEQLGTQIERLMDRLDQLPPEVAARIARRFRELRVEERGTRLADQGRQHNKQVQKLPDHLEQVPREVVDRLGRQFEYLTGQGDQLAKDLEQLLALSKQRW